MARLVFSDTGEEEYLRISVNLVQYAILPWPYFFAKNYSENTPFFAQLCSNRWIAPISLEEAQSIGLDNNHVSTGHVSVPVCKVCDGIPVRKLE